MKNKTAKPKLHSRKFAVTRGRKAKDIMPDPILDENLLLGSQNLANGEIESKIRKILEDDEPSLPDIPKIASASYSALLIKKALDKKFTSERQRGELRKALKKNYEQAKSQKGIENDDTWLQVAIAVEDYATAAEICLKLNRFCDAEQYLEKSGMEPADACRMLGEFCMSKGFYTYAASFFRKSGDKDKEVSAKTMKTYSPAITDMLMEVEPLKEDEP
jgi:hypothetical protein